MDDIDIVGTPIPNAGPVFITALAIHVTAGLICVTCGAMAALTRKESPWHKRFGRTYLWGLVVVFVTLTVMSAIRWRENAHLFAIGILAFTAGLTGYMNRRRRPDIHILGMGSSYVLLLTGFYVDNGPHLPLWDRLPAAVYWGLPTLIGLPLIARAIARRRHPGPLGRCVDGPAPSARERRLHDGAAGPVVSSGAGGVEDVPQPGEVLPVASPDQPQAEVRRGETEVGECAGPQGGRHGEFGE